MEYLKNSYKTLKHLIAIPLVSSLIIPLLIADIWVEIYHRICFPLYKIPCIKRKAYIKIIDRAKLKYLNFWQKIYCMYCGYGNGVVNYWTKIADETERYWCGIKHEKDNNFIESESQKDFAEYNDEESFNKKYKI